MSARRYVVIGAGLVGVASAYRLRRAGYDVVLVDPGDIRRAASFGNIGHIAAEQIEPLASPHVLGSFWRRLFAFGGPVDFRLSDAAMLAPWIADFLTASSPQNFARGGVALKALMRDALAAWMKLADEAGCADLVAASGHAVVWMKGELPNNWRDADFGSASARPMEAEERAAYREVLRAPPRAGLIFSGTGQVHSPQAVRAALLDAFHAAGGLSVQGKVVRLNAHASGVAVGLENGDVLEGEGAVVSAGAWSRAIMATLGVHAPLIGERGYSIQSVNHRWPESLPPTVFEEHALVLTRFNNGLRASSFVEFGSPDAPPDARKWRAIARKVERLGVTFDAAPDLWYGPRPTLPDYLPAVGRLERAPRVLYAFGHQHLGLTLAARTSELVADLALGAPSDLDLAPFRIERFARKLAQ